MSTRTRLIGLGIIALALLWGMAAGGDMLMFVNWPTIIFMLGLLIGGLWTCFGSRRVLRAFATAFGGKGDRAEAARVFAMGGQISWGAGMLIMLVGLIIILNRIGDPSMIGPGMAVALLSMVYAVALAELFFNPLRHAMLNPPGAEPSTDTATVRPRHLGYAMSLVLFALLLFAVLMVSIAY